MLISRPARARLASLGDVFVNESMEALHTTDASVAGVQIETRVAGRCCTHTHMPNTYISYE